MLLTRSKPIQLYTVIYSQHSECFKYIEVQWAGLHKTFTLILNENIHGNNQHDSPKKPLIEMTRCNRENINYVVFILFHFLSPLSSGEAPVTI